MKLCFKLIKELIEFYKNIGKSLQSRKLEIGIVNPFVKLELV